MSYKVLIVDESFDIACKLKSIIENGLNAQVFIASTMKDSASLILEHKGKFDIVLADLSLSDAPNGEIVSFIRKFSIPIVVLTRSEQLEKENHFRKNENIVDYIIKDGTSALNYASSIVRRIVANKNIKVLVVDDSKTFIEKTKDLLKRYKLIALSAMDGKEALEILEKNKDIKIVLTDFMMPVMDGIELTKNIRKEYSKDELSIIVSSSDTSKKISSTFLKIGANDFLYKGFSDEEFFARINSNLEILELFDEIKNKANKDYMTGLYNRRYLFDMGYKIYEENKLNKKDFAVAILDIDKFKNINDQYGHDIGDVAIKEVANILNENILGDALISRLGGEEFCILLYNKTKKEIEDLLEKIRLNFENNYIKLNDIELKYTVSIGCSFDYGKNIDEMIQSADRGLYEAKENGRNQVRYR